MQTQGTFQNKGTFQGSYPILKFFKAKLEIGKDYLQVFSSE